MKAESHFEEIHSVISSKIVNAKKEIKAAVAWFTDPDLIELLAHKAKNGVVVDLIISDNETNQKTDYSSLQAAGVNLQIYPQKGYGSMHHKFCIIDKEMVITGSYNWTINAKRNNGENIMIAKDEETINNYLKEFTDLQYLLQNGTIPENVAGNGHETGVKIEIPEPEKFKEKPTPSANFQNDFEEEWNVYLNSHVLNYDKEKLKSEGREWAENTQGNPDVIYKYLDTIYQGLVSDTTVDEHEVELLSNRLEQRMTYYHDKANEDAVFSSNVAELNKIAKQKTCENSIINSKINQEKLESEKKAIESTKIPNLEAEKERQKKNIEDLSIEITPPPLRRRIWVEGFMIFILSFYLFVFYSSIIYTILYGADDARNFLETQGQIPQVEVFNGDALSLAWDRGWIIFSFICLFTILPFVFGYLFHQFRKISKLGWAILYLAMAVILDGLLAYLITKNVYLIDYMASRETVTWEWTMAFSIVRFYIVLFLGAVPYFVWGGLLEHIWSQLDRSSRSELYFKKELEIKHLKERIEEKEKEIVSLRNRINDIEREIIDLKGKIENAQKEIFYVDHELEVAKQQIQRELTSRITTLSHQKEKIMAYLNKDRIPISYSALKDRINTFLGGWDEWLYSYYSTKKSNELVSESHHKVNDWLKNKNNELEA